MRSPQAGHAKWVSSTANVAEHDGLMHCWKAASVVASGRIRIGPVCRDIGRHLPRGGTDSWSRSGGSLIGLPVPTPPGRTPSTRLAPPLLHFNGPGRGATGDFRLHTP